MYFRRYTYVPVHTYDTYPKYYFMRFVSIFFFFFSIDEQCSIGISMEAYSTEILNEIVVL